MEKMRRIKVEYVEFSKLSQSKFYDKLNCISEGINEIMDYLEKKEENEELKQKIEKLGIQLNERKDGFLD